MNARPISAASDVQRPQRHGDARLEMDGQPVGGHEHGVDRRGDPSDRSGGVGGQQGPAAGQDALAEARHDRD
jgi:hypothetical protein